MCKYHLYLIIGSWYKVKTRFSQNCIFDLDLWPCDLDLRSTLTSHWYQSYVQVSSISNHWFMVYSQISFLQTCMFDLDLWPFDLDLWPTSTSQQYLSCVCASSMCNHWLMIYSQNTYFHKIAYLTLAFDLVTLTLGQHQHLINTYHIYQHH